MTLIVLTGSDSLSPLLGLSVRGDFSTEMAADDCSQSTHRFDRSRSD